MGKVGEGGPNPPFPENFDQSERRFPMNELMWLASEEDGQGMVEYGLIIALVSVVLIAVLTTLSGSLNDIFQAISDTLKGVTP